MLDRDRCERIAGRFKRRCRRAASSEIALKGMGMVRPHVRAQRLAKTLSAACGSQIFRGHKERGRYADGSFIAKGHWPDDASPCGHVGVALALEVMASNATATKVTTVFPDG